MSVYVFIDIDTHKRTHAHARALITKQDHRLAKKIFVFLYESLIDEDRAKHLSSDFRFAKLTTTTNYVCKSIVNFEVSPACT